MGDLKILIYLDFLKFRNGLLQFFKNPLDIIKKGIFTLIYFGFFLYLFIKRKGESDAALFASGDFLEFIYMILVMIVLVGVLTMLAHYFNNYSPSNFSMSDVEYIFPTPMNKNVILVYSLIRTGIKGLMSAIAFIVMIGFMLVKKANISVLGILSTGMGIFFVFIMFISIGYLIFAIQTKYNLGKLFKRISVFLNILIPIYGVSIFLRGYFSEWEFLSWGFEDNIPIVSSIANIVLSLFKENFEFPLMDVGIMIFVSIISIITFILLDLDYYEAVAEKVSNNNEKLKEARGIQERGTLANSIEERAKHVDKSSSAKEFMGAGAFYWKAALSRRRLKSPIKRHIFDVLALAMGIGLVILAKIKPEIAIYIVVGAGIAVIYLLFIIADIKSELMRELKNMYIYIFPGKPITKIFNIILDEILLILMRATLILLPGIVFIKEARLIGIGMLLAIFLIAILLKIKAVIIALLTPQGKSSGANFTSILFNAVIVAIPVAAGGFTYKLWDSIPLTIIVSSLVVLALIGILTWIIGIVFDRLEY